MPKSSFYFSVFLESDADLPEPESEPPVDPASVVEVLPDFESDFFSEVAFSSEVLGSELVSPFVAERT